MNTLTEMKNMNELIERYYSQDASLPQYVREKLGNETIELYGIADLNVEMKFQHTWVILCEDKIVIFEENDLVGRNILISRIIKVRERSSLSSTTYSFLEADDKLPLLTLHFSGRQKVLMGHLKYLLETKIKGHDHQRPEKWNPDEEYQKAILKTILDSQNNSGLKKSKTFWRLLSYLRPYKKEVLWGSLGAIGSTLVSLIPAYLSGKIIDDIMRPFQGGDLTQEEALKSSWIIVSAIFSIYVLREFFIWIRLNKMSIMGEHVAQDLRAELYGHLQTLELDFFSRKQTGSIISRVSSDTDRIWDFIAFGVIEVGIALISILSLSFVLISMDFRLGLLMALPVPFFLYAIYFHGEKMKKLFLRAWTKWSDLTNVLSDTIPGIQVVKAFGQEQKEISRFNKANDIVTNEFKNIHHSWTKFWPVLMMGISLMMISVWIFAVPRLISNTGSQDHLTVGTFVSFLLYMTMFSHPIEVIGQMSRMVNRALSSAYRIFEILDTVPSMKNGTVEILREDFKGNVSFKEVTFSYDGVRPILKGVSFDVKQGEMIGLVGASGGGKSTITKLIARFYDVNSGQVLIDGKDIKTLEVGSFRKKIGMVLQDPYLFHGTLFENICYGMPKISLKKIIEAAKVANAHEFITRLPEGYETIIGERGHTLSGGERQRVSIARAILHDPKILILDEATSAVDTETERKIQDALDKLIEGRTVFAVAHRLSTLRKADRIFVIDKGEIKEEGKHSDLLKKENGIYSKLQRMQQEMSESFIR